MVHRRKGQARGGVGRRASGQVQRRGGPRERRVFAAVQAARPRSPNVNDSAPNPSPELGIRKRRNPFGVVGRARRGETS